ncbi:hypothetical protein PYW08_006533 [Mythimna loreyi]|uniref:Uncharacterized protein n=1 Tax=Mythimna loreyi TaxID=667449 RepID=A0ACC2QT20_9NEOP|nr:hypothetical protein PYW08_006533 [Mythimna loreyi]
MYSAAVISKVKTVQLGLSYLAMLQFTAYLWPKQAIVEDGASFDYIVVGAGTAGSVIANRLTEDENVNVLLIEAGGDAPIEGVVPGCTLFAKRSRFDWNYTTENDEFTKKCHQKPYFEMTLGKMLGGTSSLNYMLYSRGHPTDYDNWADITKDPTWNWENVLPYFIKSERVEDADFIKSPDIVNHGINGLAGLTRDPHKYLKDMVKSFKEIGNDIINDPGSSLGYSLAFTYISSGRRQSSAISFLSPAKDRKNLHVLKNTLVTKVNFDENKNAVGVETILENDKTINIKASKEVIISAGVFNSAKLLLLSGIGPKADLESKNIDVITDLPVGKNLQDHTGVVILHAMEKSDPEPFNPNLMPGAPTMGFTALDKTQNFPDYETLTFSAHANGILYFCAFVYRLSYDICDNIYVGMMGRMGLFNEIVSLRPKSKGVVTLRSTNPMDPPVVTSGHLTDEADLDDLVKYVKDFVPIVNTTYFRSVGAEMIDPMSGGCSEFEKGSDEYWKCYTTCLFSGQSNYVGTCAMGSVVDSRLRVIGVQRLRVADASIMPVITKGNTMAPIIMIGEKVSDFIKEDSKNLS